MRSHLTQVFKYFAFFDYCPTLEEVYTFYPKEISKKDLTHLVEKGVLGHSVTKIPKNLLFRTSQKHIFNWIPQLRLPRYTLPQYSIRTKNILKKKLPKYLNRTPLTIQVYLSILNILPFVRFIGVTGSTAMDGYMKGVDIDLCIISGNGSLWTTRFCAVALAKLLRIHGGSGVCLNLFFDVNDLMIPRIKQNVYIAHEILQMKPIVNKRSTHSLLIQANKWIYMYFPNAPHFNIIQNKRHIVFDLSIKPIEQFLKSLQLPLIKRNKTGFRITAHQLWLFRHDFERSLRKKHKL